MKSNGCYDIIFVLLLIMEMLMNWDLLTYSLIISIAAVTAGGKTAVVNKLKDKFDNVCTLHFDDYTFEGVL